MHTAHTVTATIWALMFIIFVSLIDMLRKMEMGEHIFGLIFLLAIIGGSGLMIGTLTFMIGFSNRAVNVMMLNQLTPFWFIACMAMILGVLITAMADFLYGFNAQFHVEVFETSLFVGVLLQIIFLLLTIWSLLALGFLIFQTLYFQNVGIQACITGSIRPRVEIIVEEVSVFSMEFFNQLCMSLYESCGATCDNEELIREKTETWFDFRLGQDPGLDEQLRERIVQAAFMYYRELGKGTHPAKALHLTYERYFSPIMS